MTDEHADRVQEWHEHGLTTTSFAVLGLLSMQEWTTYELAQQMKRSFSYFWPRAERRIYDEPRRLADAGYVASRREIVGRRPRTCWSITDGGRKALRAWLAVPLNSPLSLEFEGMVKVFLAENGDKAGLGRVVNQIAESAQRQLDQLAAMCADLESEGGRFPGRMHVNALAMDYAIAVQRATLEWAQRAEGAITGWRTTSSPGPAAREAAREFFAQQAGD